MFYTCLSSHWPPFSQATFHIYMHGENMQLHSERPTFNVVLRNIPHWATFTACQHQINYILQVGVKCTGQRHDHQQLQSMVKDIKTIWNIFIKKIWIFILNQPSESRRNRPMLKPTMNQSTVPWTSIFVQKLLLLTEICETSQHNVLKWHAGTTETIGSILRVCTRVFYWTT